MMETEQIREIAWAYSEGLLKDIKEKGGTVFDMQVAAEMIKNYASASGVIEGFVDKEHLTEI